MSALGLVNFCLCQWLGFRLARRYQGDRPVGWGLLGPVAPLTGWWSPYRPRRPRFTPLGWYQI